MWQVWAARIVKAAVVIASAYGITIAASAEIRTSTLQSVVLSRVGQQLKFWVDAGPNPEARFPEAGPYNQRLGYTMMPATIKALSTEGFIVEWQARISPRMDQLLRQGSFAVFHEKSQAGLTLLDSQNRMLYRARYPERVYEGFDAVPSLVVDTLLFIENRELLDPQFPYRNPAIEWDRFAAALLTMSMQSVAPEMNVPGGSTLATQMEKFRHSPEGRTAHAGEKLRQIASASFRAYLDGIDTTGARRRIVVDYLNSTPLTARLGFGEVNGLGDGLWAWFGTDFAEANALLATGEAKDPARLREQARIYKQVLSLLLAQRRPSYYLVQDHQALEVLAASHLRVLAAAGVISPAFRDAALAQKLDFSPKSPPPREISFLDQKAANAIRTRLLSLIGVRSLYELDRLDLRVETSLHMPTQERVVDTLRRLGTPAFAEELGMTGFRLLNPANDLSQVVYSVTIYERGPLGNHVRVQADTLDRPLDLNEQAKLDLGSTAKLRTLATYLEILAELHQRHSGLSTDELAALEQRAHDPLTRWAARYLAQAVDRSLQPMLDAAMERRYSANPGERFFTGSGSHVFHNFDGKDNGKILTATEAFRNSVNLPFIRMMRDIVQFHIAESSAAAGDLFADGDNPARAVYLARFADREGKEFMDRFIPIYRGRTADEALDVLAGRTKKRSSSLATIFLSVRPQASDRELREFLLRHLPEAKLDPSDIDELYDRYAIENYNLADRGYIAGVHPLELWLVQYLQDHEAPLRSQIMAASAAARQESYAWLFKTSRRNAQDTRIRILLEADAFKAIHRSWQHLGYPFNSLVPSYATSIGSSGDRPGALAELMGIIVNDGMRLPTVRIERLYFAEQTPYEAVLGLEPIDETGEPAIVSELRDAQPPQAESMTKMPTRAETASDAAGEPMLNVMAGAGRDGRWQDSVAGGGHGAGERVMLPEVAASLRKALMDVAAEGTARRISGVFTNPDGSPAMVGAKTGTGDHRFEKYGAEGRLIESRVVNRTATIVFFIGDRFFGVVTAHVAGQKAEDYEFTSGLTAQLLKSLAPALQPLLVGSEVHLAAAGDLKLLASDPRGPFDRDLRLVNVEY